MYSLFVRVCIINNELFFQSTRSQSRNSFNLTVTLRDGHFWPKGKNFTCNVFTNFHAFPFLVGWLLNGIVHAACPNPIRKNFKIILFPGFRKGSTPNQMSLSDLVHLISWSRHEIVTWYCNVINWTLIWFHPQSIEWFVYAFCIL